VCYASSKFLRAASIWREYPVGNQTHLFDRPGSTIDPATGQRLLPVEKFETPVRDPGVDQAQLPESAERPKMYEAGIGHILTAEVDGNDMTGSAQLVARP